MDAKFMEKVNGRIISNSKEKVRFAIEINKEVMHSLVLFNAKLVLYTLKRELKNKESNVDLFDAVASNMLIIRHGISFHYREPEKMPLSPECKKLLQKISDKVKKINEARMIFDPSFFPLKFSFTEIVSTEIGILQNRKGENW